MADCTIRGVIEAGILEACLADVPLYMLLFGSFAALCLVAMIWLP